MNVIFIIILTHTYMRQNTEANHILMTHSAQYYTTDTIIFKTYFLTIISVHHTTVTKQNISVMQQSQNKYKCLT